MRILRVDLNSLDAAGATVVHRFATSEYTTPASADTLSGCPALTNIPGRLEQAGDISRHCFGDGRVRGSMEISFGTIGLINVDGEIDSLATSYAFDGQTFSIYEIDETTLLPTVRLRQGYIEQPVFDLETVTFHVRDVQHALDIELLTVKYAGTNSGAPLAGIEGTAADIGGTNKPVAVGIQKNVTPILVNTTRQIYQVDGVQGFLTGYAITVYDKRAVVPQGAVYASQADMETNAPAAGQCRIWPAGGCVRFGTTPVRPTVDVDNPPAGAGTSKYTQVLKKLAGLRGFTIVTYISITDYACGIWVADNRTLLAALNEVLQSATGFITAGISPNTPTPTQQLWSSHLAGTGSAPTVPYTPVIIPITLNDKEDALLHIQQQEQNDETRGQPVWKVNVAYQKNYTVMSPTDLAGVALAEQVIWGQEYRIASASDAAVKNQWPNAIELNVTTLLDSASEAAAEASRLLTMFKSRRKFFRVRVPQSEVRDQISVSGVGTAAHFQLQSQVTFAAGYPRFALAGATLIVLGIQENNRDDTYEFVLWG